MLLFKHLSSLAMRLIWPSGLPRDEKKLAQISQENRESE